MAWPFDMYIRPFMRMVSYWLGRGYDRQEIIDWAASSRDYYQMDRLLPAIPEAARANYFGSVIGMPKWADTPFAQLWGYYARGTWYAGYGRAPTAAERSWAYTRPQDALGLMVAVTGTDTSGRPVRYTVTVNASWSDSLQDVRERVTQYMLGNLPGVAAPYTYDLDPDTIEVNVIGGALVERQAPTIPLMR